MTEDLSNIHAALTAQQQQIADAQQRLTALEAAGRGGAAGGDLAGLVATVLSVASRFARTAAEAHAAQDTTPADAPAPAAERPLGRLAARLAELREDRAAEPEHRDHVHRRLTPEEAAAVPPKSMFPITEDQSGLRPAAPYAGRTAPRRTLPPEAPVRLWNRDYTDKLDVIGRAASGGLDGVQRIRIRDEDTAAALGWLTHGRKHDGAFVRWMDREWILESWVHNRSTNVRLDLLPMPKPPRVDEVLGRAPYAGPFPHLAKGDRIGVEHPDTGEVTIHEFSGDPAQPVADDVATGLAEQASAMRSAMFAALELDRCGFTVGGRQCGKTDGHEGQHAVPGPGGLWKVPEPVGTVTSGLIHARPEQCGASTPDPVSDATFTCELDSGHDGPHHRDLHHDVAWPNVPEWPPLAARTAILFHVADGGSAETTVTETHIGADGLFALVRFDDANAQLFLRHRRDTIRATWNGRDWTVRDIDLHSTRDTTVHLGPLPGEPGAPDTKTPAYADLYARLDAIHDATAEEDQQ